jgi:hypothetical protein
MIQPIMGVFFRYKRLYLQNKKGDENENNQKRNQGFFKPLHYFSRTTCTLVFRNNRGDLPIQMF